MIYLLYIISMFQGVPDVQVSTFNSEEQCLREVRNIIQQGSSAYCVPVKRES